MSNVIDHFMWSYQQHFRIGKQGDAKSIFEMLDDRIDPELFLVGILVEVNKQKYPACVEPENEFWIQSEAFNSTLKNARKIKQAYPENSHFHSHPIAHEKHDKALFLRSVRDAIKKIIDEKSTNKKYYYVSVPTKVDCYLVSIVLSLSKAIVDLYPALNSSQAPIHEFLSADVTTSLIDATIDNYLEKASNELNSPNPGEEYSRLNAEEVVRESGQKFVTDMAFRASNTCVGGWHGLFDACNRIASTFYEKSVGKGSFVLTAKSHHSIQTIIEFTTPADLGDTRGARKFLELALQDLAIHTDSEKIYGLVKFKFDDENEEKVFLINILDHHHWEIRHFNKVLMRVKYGLPYLPKPTFNEDKLRDDLPRLFKDITEKQSDRIVDLVKGAEKEEHGTMLVISKRANTEAKRLGKQATLIKPKILTTKILSSLTSIDGAVLINPRGTCYAIGVILDGMANEDGDPSRGSRYNSALRYVKTLKDPCLAIVISEDGGIDFIPDLKPTLRESDIRKRINLLENVAKQDSISQKEYRDYTKTMDWFDKHRFYLLEEHCEKINQFMGNVELKFEFEGSVRPRIIYQSFVHNPEFDEDLFYIDE
ncbi:DisA bacterial checkpoint controller nucleotide-binding protein [Gimesia panareensis]|uniref:DisA bacterial checkpoint controller nucleotide-binding protein n=1 Tax=Gimesia panareensis TaxID=2527978 RepID=A0A518FVC5_9PLAN|nr:DNA integrity scanning protein DisA nucleotide-binding domain protein [Gimesia panareensis]QDV20304.1 DisA bacterial checkpoint controller nucleotide-binding protein [Gimesia panareensis]